MTLQALGAGHIGPSVTSAQGLRPSGSGAK